MFRHSHLKIPNLKVQGIHITYCIILINYACPRKAKCILSRRIHLLSILYESETSNFPKNITVLQPMTYTLVSAFIVNLLNTITKFKILRKWRATFDRILKKIFKRMQERSARNFFHISHIVCNRIINDQGKCKDT